MVHMRAGCFFYIFVLKHSLQNFNITKKSLIVAAPLYRWALAGRGLGAHRSHSRAQSEKQGDDVIIIRLMKIFLWILIYKLLIVYISPE